MSGKLISGAIIAMIVAIVSVVIIIVLSGDDPDEATVDNGEPVALGDSIYQQLCAGCHSIDGSSSIGPTLEGLYNSEVEMEDGSMVHIDADHLREAIIDPRATTRAGYPDVMPPFSDLDDDEIDGLVAFIQSLE